MAGNDSNSEGDPRLLDSLFDDSALDPLENRSAEETLSSSDSSVDYEDIADMILSRKEQYLDKWICERDVKFKYSSFTNKLMLIKNNCCFEYQGDGEFQFLKPLSISLGDNTVDISNTENSGIGSVRCSLAIWTKEEMSLQPTCEYSFKNPPKRVRVEDPSVSESYGDPLGEVNGVHVTPSLEEFSPSNTETESMPFPLLVNHLVSTVLPDLGIFLEKWNLEKEEFTVRYLLKRDRQLVEFVMTSFSPQKALPKNALIKYVQALSKYPQKWRTKTDAFNDREGILEETRDSYEVGAGVRVVRVLSDWYAIVDSEDFSYVMVNGVKTTSVDGPVGPLVNGSIIAFSKVKDFAIPDRLVVVKLESMILVGVADDIDEET